MMNYPQDKLTDEQLLEALSKDNTEAYAELYNRYFEDIYKHVFAKVGREEDTKDIVHEIFLKLWEKRTHCANVRHVKGYLFMITRNHIFDLIAHHKVIQKYYDSFLSTISMAEAADYRVHQQEIQRQLDEAVGLLPDRMREVFELSRNEYLSHREISERLNISEKTVKTQINNALKVLRKKLHPFFHFFLF